eukprot:1798577-Rhodomonas_salina.1
MCDACGAEQDGSTLEVDCVMFATGRAPRTENLGLEKVHARSSTVFCACHASTVLSTLSPALCLQPLSLYTHSGQSLQLAAVWKRDAAHAALMCRGGGAARVVGRLQGAGAA